MSIKTLHKYLFSITLLLSLASFQGYATTPNKTITTTELIVTEHLVSEVSTYYLSFATYKLEPTPNSFTEFSFNNLIYTQEKCYALMFKVQSQTSFIVEKLNNISQLKLISPVNTDVFKITS